MKSGIILLDKEPGITSARAIALLKKKLMLERIGHAGTLDPMASGLLVCLAGSSTKLATHAEHGDKIYSGIILLGVSTDSDDITGRVISQSAKVPDFSYVRECAGTFCGECWQEPPQVSAIKIQGVPAYKKARCGEHVSLSKRKVMISSFELSALEGARIAFKIKCSKGTYIRSIARDLGAALGCGGCLAELRREQSSPFHLAQARKLADLDETHIIGAEALFPEAMPMVTGRAQAARLGHGDPQVISALGVELRARGGTHAALYEERETIRAYGLLIPQDSSWSFKAI